MAVELAGGDESACRLVDLVEGIAELLRGDLSAIDADALGGLDEMRRGVEAGPDAGGAKRAIEEGACGALAVRAGDMDETQRLLRGAKAREEALNAVETQLDGLVLIAERVQEADRIRIGRIQENSSREDSS
jgi:hypothetical protein